MKIPSQRLIWLSAVGILILGLLFWTWRKDKGHSVPMAVLSPMGADGKRDWSKAVVHYESYEVGDKDQEWSHWEIAQKHKAFLMKDLPGYITELRGGSRFAENDSTGAEWYFEVPREHMDEFRQYLLDLGVPEKALKAEFSLPLPDTYYVDDYNRERWPPAPTPPATRLLFVHSMPAARKSGDPVEYRLINPNFDMTCIRIQVAWKSGRVEVWVVRVRQD